MLTYNTLYRPVDDGSVEQLQMAAWLQYLLDRLDLACTISLAGRETHLIALASRTRHALDEQMRQGGSADLALLIPWLNALLGDDAYKITDWAAGASGQFLGEYQLAIVERHFPGSQAIYASAHGLTHAYGFHDSAMGWAALEAIELGLHTSARESEAILTYVRWARSTGLPAEHIIDEVIGRVWQSDEAERRIDEMAALVDCAAALARRTDTALALYGGEHNKIAFAIERDRKDLGTTDGLLAALAVCRLERLIDAGAFWPYYLLAGIVTSAPHVVEAIGQRFYGMTWHKWLNALLAKHLDEEIVPREEAVWSRLRTAMSFSAASNPIVHRRRRLPR
ncbi:hypothetical protein [Burkholderia alba]|uniref:hypothetical protein n=1 Tax=Burkholderia alba TaxID=2683677 RepID=UPI002B058D79|nr:hypothetical protein [Burkholderia alba]